MPDREHFDPSDLDDLLNLGSRAYDLVMNGEELGGGSLRIHRMDVQNRVFQALGLDRNEIESKFGFFLKALLYGAPPHGGIAVGIDRLASMVLGTGSIRDVIAFPKNRSAACPLTNAPSMVKEAHLNELGLKIWDEDRSDLDKYDGNAQKPARQGEIHELITREDVLHVAQLARITLSDSEVSALKEDLNPILEYVETLRKLETLGVKPPEPSPGAMNVWREDVPGETNNTEGILENAPAREDAYFKVPKILEG
jgi:aspartyl-tRNA synthetase